MKIIKHGKQPKKPKPISFTCSVCGCEFEAEESEYTRDGEKKIFHCECPECGKTNGQYVPTAEDVVTPFLTASFHGESWYACPICKKSFEYYQAVNSRCPNCNQKFYFR